MKTKIISSTILASSLVLSSMAFADENATEQSTEQSTEHTAEQPRHWSIGIGSYAFSVANDSSDGSDMDFSGFNITAGYAINNHFQVRGTYFTLDNDENSAVESSGFEMMAYGGVGFAESGFRGYGGVGFFSDEWSFSSESESMSGIQFGGGLGYNWGPVALDFVLTLRQADEYEDFMYETGTYVAMSGNLSVSYLF